MSKDAVFLGNSMTIEFGKICKFYCQKFLLSFRRLLRIWPQNFDLHRSDPQRSGTPNISVIAKVLLEGLLRTSMTRRRGRPRPQEFFFFLLRTLVRIGLGYARKFRNAEMTIKITFERSSQKGGRQGVRKEGRQETHLEISLSA